MRTLLSEVPVSSPRSSGRLGEFGLLVALRLFWAQSHPRNAVSGGPREMLWCNGATFHDKQKEDAGIHLLGGLSADMGVFLLTGFFTLFTGTTEGREAGCLW